MTRWRGLLVSVRDPAEAEAALAGGATIIDVKDPARGSLGAATPAVIAAVAQAVGGRVPWTFAAGELADLPPVGERPPWAGGGPAAAAIKIGLAGMGSRKWRETWHDALATMPSTIERVAVAYADWRRVAAPEPAAIVAAGAEAGCRLLLIDTADKTAAGLCSACTAADLHGWIGQARAVGMRVILAGRLTIEEIPRIRQFNADVVAMRSAVCSNGRMGSVDAVLVRRAAAMIDHTGESSL